MSTEAGDVHTGAADSNRLPRRLHCESVRRPRRNRLVRGCWWSHGGSSCWFRPLPRRHPGFWISPLHWQRFQPSHWSGLSAHYIDPYLQQPDRCQHHKHHVAALSNRLLSLRRRALSHHRVQSPGFFLPTFSGPNVSSGYFFVDNVSVIGPDSATPGPATLATSIALAFRVRSAKGRPTRLLI